MYQYTFKTKEEAMAYGMKKVQASLASGGTIVGLASVEEISVGPKKGRWQIDFLVDVSKLER